MAQLLPAAARIGLVAAILSASGSLAAAAAAAADGPDCAAAAAVAEREQGLPTGILGAIGSVESGGRPLAIDVDGSAVLPATAADATEAVRSAAARGARFIDVGCFQVDLHWHPDAFADLSAAFDPLNNARVAARFLSTLRNAAGSWDAAIGRYHSATVAGISYAARVLERWHGGGGGSVAAAAVADRPRARLVAFGMRVVAPGEGGGTGGGLPAVETP